MPIFIVVIFGCVDANRYVYIRSQLNTRAVNAARLLALPASRDSDCAGLSTAEATDGWFTLNTDPASIFGDSAPPSATAVSSGTGYVYIYPAAATRITGTYTCTGPNRDQSYSGSVTVRITYSFDPSTPVLGAYLSLPIVASATEPTEY
jgi:hypothetical protein